LEDVALSGYFTLQKAGITHVTIQMPFLVFVVLNSLHTFQICDGSLLTPLDPNWKGAEMIVIASLQTNIRNLQEKKRKTAK
jgi:hypothetical protein